MAIRWRNADIQNLTRTVKNFNNKIKRIQIENPALKDYLPSPVSEVDIIARTNTRQDFNNTVKSLQRFLEQGAETPVTSEQGIKTTTWQLQEAKYMIQRINFYRANERKAAGLTKNVGEMGSTRYNSLSPKKLRFDSLSPKNWNKYLSSLNKLSSSDYHKSQPYVYKANYLKNIIQNLGTGPQAMALYSLIESLSADVIYNVYYDDPVLQINFLSDPLDGEFIAESALLKWSDYLSRL